MQKQASKLNESDLKILQILKHNARISNTELSTQVNLCASSCARRISKMEKLGYIKRYETVVDDSLFEKKFQVIVRLMLETQNNKKLREIETILTQNPSIISCDLLSGETDYEIRVCVKDAQEYNDLHDNFLSRLPHISCIKSHFIIKNIFMK